MNNPSVCPHCGFDLAEDEPVERAGIAMQPYGEVRFNGAAIALTKAETGVLWALMKADRPLPRPILSERIGHEGDGNCIDVLICRIRRKLAPHGPVPIQTRRGVGVSIEA